METQRPSTIQWKSPTSKVPKKPSRQRISTEEDLQIPAPHEAPPPPHKETHTTREQKNPESQNPHPQAVSPTNIGWVHPPSNEGLEKPQTKADEPSCRETTNKGQIPTSPPPHPHQHNDPLTPHKQDSPTTPDPHTPARGAHHSVIMTVSAVW